jgi:hypothetical protein
VHTMSSEDRRDQRDVDAIDTSVARPGRNHALGDPI